MAVTPSISKKITAPKAAIYIRVSTHWQVDKDSLQVQRRELGRVGVRRDADGGLQGLLGGYCPLV